MTRLVELIRRFTVILFLFAVGVAGVNLTPAAVPSKITRLIVQPSAIELSSAEAEHGLLVTAVGADGQLSDVTRWSQFSTKSPKVIAVSTNGICRALADGRAEIIVSFNGKSEKIFVTATNSALSGPPSFRQDVIPVLTRFGCSAGVCHGKLAGQNGFKLSLRGYAPELDHEWLTTELRTRRIDPASPANSLLVLKPIAQVPHQGGERFAEGSPAYRVLVDWIAARAPGPNTNETDAARLEIFPGNRIMRVGDRQQLLARAHYADGRVRDVTWLTQFFSNDEATVAVTPEGVVRPLRAGETAIRAHFQGQVEVIIITIPYENKIAPGQFVAKNNLVDEPVFAKLKSLNIPPSALCDDATFVRRAFLDVTGTLPLPEEVRTFLADKDADKRARLIDQLLERPDYVDFWTLELADLLQNRKERDHDVRGAKGVRSFHTWLRAQVAANRPWNELAREVITASGDVVGQPQIGYYITLVGEKRAEESEITDAVALSFLGTRIGCAKCHNHPLEKFTQDDYYHFAAFFSRVSMKREESSKGLTKLFNESKEADEQKKQIVSAEKSLAEAEAAAAKVDSANKIETDKAVKKIAEQKKRLEDTKLQLVKVLAKMPSISQPRTKKPMIAQPLDRSVPEFKPGDDPRAPLAAWITSPKNEAFSGAMVNRLWKHFFSVGLVEQVDDLRASNPPSNPELWRALSQEFVAHGYDLKHVMRLIMNSRTYQLSSATVPGNATEHRFYSHYYARRLPAEVLMDAMSQATGVPDKFDGYPLGARAIQLPEPGVASYFLTLFGRSDRVTACACERSGAVTLPQLLHLQSGDELTKKLRATDGRLVTLLKEKDDARVVCEIFLSTLGRPPTAAEQSAFNKALAGGGARDEVYADLFWALLNTKEFAFNH